jgi:hypothetical protein
MSLKEKICKGEPEQEKKCEGKGKDEKRGREN